MKFAQKEVYDLLVFDNNEELVSNLDSLTQVDIVYSEKDETYFVIAKDALLNTDFLKFVGKENKQTELQKALGKKNSISVGKSNNKVCKLIAKSLIRNIETEIDQEIVLEFPSVKVVSKPSFVGSIYKVTEFDAIFEVIPVDGEFYKIHI
jgi:hypothetical protein